MSRWTFAGIGIALLAVGCGGGGGKRVPVTKTSGTLVWANHPVLGLLVVLHPTDPSTPKTPVQPTGVVHEDGHFTITCYDVSDRAPPGEYAVTIRTAPRPEGSPPLTLPSEKYRSPTTTPLKVVIERKPINELEPLVIDE